MNEFERCDMILVQRNLASSRTRAQSLIKAGFVFCNGDRVLKPSHPVSESDQLEVRGEVCPYVSRGGFKLEKALKVFNIDAKDQICIDIGASTGGFTDVLLKNGAQKVYSLDVGTSQLADSLRTDPRVIVMEQTNARTMLPDMFDPLPSLAVMDVSFISIRLIMPAIRGILSENGILVALIKPQFEAGKSNIGKNGIVSDKKVHIRVLQDLVSFAYSTGWNVIGLDYSPITGSDGNIEYLAQLQPSEANAADFDYNTVRSLVELAHRAHK